MISHPPRNEEGRVTDDLKSFLAHLDATIARSRRHGEAMIFVETEKLAAVVAALRFYEDRPVRVPAKRMEVAQ